MSIHFGVDYYPEHWPEERWKIDAKLMQEMGVQVVRLAEFSWHKLEPEEGVFDFAWLDRIIDLLKDYNIKVILGVPSAAPPAWMINRYPEILPIDRENRVRGFGGRHHDCQSNPLYRAFIRKLLTRLMMHYGMNTNIVGWQTDNELGNSHQDLCTCNNCRKEFQRWLKNKYQTVAALNSAWGNAFWSQEVNSFEEVFTPKITVSGVNPAQLLDWKRFCSDLIVDFQNEQVAIIRKYSKGQFITHNFMGFADKVNYYDLAKALDFVSHDQYPGEASAAMPHKANNELAAALDIVRSYKNKSFWIMEQQSGIIGWTTMGRTPEPGQLSSWALQSIAHGADAIIFFRWRVCAIGTEQYWHGILPHSGKPGRRYSELKHTVKEMIPIMEKIKGSVPKSEVGIVFSFDQDYAIQIQPQHPELNYINQLLKYHKVIYEHQIPVDFVPVNGEFNQYKLLIAPLQYLMTPELEEKYFNYVKDGGHLILTMRTGVKDEHNNCMTDRELPGRLGDLAGIEVVDYDCLRDVNVLIHYAYNTYTATKWSDLIECKDKTQVLATYGSEFYAETPAITRNTYGKGCCYYVGTEPDEKLMHDLLKNIVNELGISSLGQGEEEVEIQMRQKGEYQWFFVINHSNKNKKYSLTEGEEANLIKGITRGSLNGYEVHIYEKRIKVNRPF